MNLWVYVSAVCLWGSELLAFVEGKLLCECTTIDCQLERRRSCEADYFCYVENINSEMTRGCINDKTPLLCENRKPSKLPSGDFEEWPYLFCCKNEDYCNREVMPVKPTEEVTVTQVNIIPDDKYNPYVREEYDDSNTPCPNSSKSDGSRLNPIYIAVPVAGKDLDLLQYWETQWDMEGNAGITSGPRVKIVDSKSALNRSGLCYRPFQGGGPGIHFEPSQAVSDSLLDSISSSVESSSSSLD